MNLLKNRAEQELDGESFSNEQWHRTQTLIVKVELE